MKKGKNLLAAVLSLVLCLSIFVPIPAGASTPVFVAVNDRVLEISADTTPIWIENEIYIPYSILDAKSNGVRWGLYCSYIKTDNFLTVYDVDQRLFLDFDLRAGTCYDSLTGEKFAPGAVLRGSRPYLPLKLICEYFGLEYSYQEIKQGKLLRIKNEDVVLSDEVFIEAASNVLNLRLKEYNQSIGLESPDPTPSAPGTPSGGESQVEKQVPTYLAFICDQADQLATLLLALEGRGVYAVIFVTPELVEERGDLMFWISGAGHTLGLVAEGEDPDQIMQCLARGSRALEKEAFLRTAVVHAPAEYLGWLEREGWVSWNSTLELVPGDGDGATSFARRTLTRLEGRTKATYLLLENNSNTLRILPTLLSRLEEAGFETDLPLETRL